MLLSLPDVQLGVWEPQTLAMLTLNDPDAFVKKGATVKPTTSKNRPEILQDLMTPFNAHIERPVKVLQSPRSP